MYPIPFEEARQYLLQNEIQVEQFLQNVPDIDLAVDMAHLNIWKTSTLSEKSQVLQIAQNRILKIHISDNDGYRDIHTTIGDRTWWIPYITRFPIHIPIVLESRMNRQSAEQVQQQIETVQSRLFVEVSRQSQLVVQATTNPVSKCSTQCDSSFD